MARQLQIDPVTGLPAVPYSGGALPLALGPGDLSGAGLSTEGPPGVPQPPEAEPDMRVAGPGGGNGGGGYMFGVPNIGSTALPTEPIKKAIGWTDPSKRAVPEGSPRAAEIAAREPASVKAAVPAVDPRTLATPGANGNMPAQASAEPEVDPLVQQAMREAMRGGGGGPRQLGVTGETRKLKIFERGADPELAQQAEQAQLASAGYNEQLAMALNKRHEEGYQAYVGEQAARAGQLAAAEERYAQKQAALQQYAAKRDALAAEAQQMKTPQMEDYWASKSTFAKIATAISIALGGALQGLRGGPNPGLEMANMAINQWMGEQKEAYNRKREGVKDAENQYARMVEAFGSERLAEEHLREQAWGVRDGLLKAYAEKVGTPNALEQYNQLMLADEAEKAALRARASQGAEVEVEQKLSMQGGGGGGTPGILKVLRAGAEAKGLRDKIEGRDAGSQPSREVQNEKVEGITGALEAIEAADEVEHTLRRLGAENADFDDPLGGPGDWLASIPGTEGRQLRQNLEQQTGLLARGIQKSLGKSDNDARLANEMAAGGGAGMQRRKAAQTARQRAVGSLQTIVSSLTPQQQQSLLQSLEQNSPARAAQVRAAIGATGTPQTAASERPAF